MSEDATSLADYPELVGFFSYSRDDDTDSKGALSRLRNRIQRELRSQLGRSSKDFRLWQDKEAIAPGKLWESEITNAVRQSVFFIPIITPTVVRSPFCKFELDSFLARERTLGRQDLVFPILYIRVPALEDAERRRADPVLSLIAQRQYVDWRDLRQLDVDSTEVGKAVEHFCGKIADALTRPATAEERRRREEEQRRLDREQEAARSASEHASASAAASGKAATVVPAGAGAATFEPAQVSQAQPGAAMAVEPQTAPDPNRAADVVFTVLARCTWLVALAVTTYSGVVVYRGWGDPSFMAEMAKAGIPLILINVGAWKLASYLNR